MYVVQKRTNVSRVMNKKGCQCRLPTETRRVLCEKDGVSFLSLLSDIGGLGGGDGGLGGGLDLLLLGRSDGGGILRLTLDRTGVVAGHLLGRAPVLRGRRKYKNSMDDRRARVVRSRTNDDNEKKGKRDSSAPLPPHPGDPFSHSPSPRRRRRRRRRYASWRTRVRRTFPPPSRPRAPPRARPPSMGRPPMQVRRRPARKRG